MRLRVYGQNIDQPSAASSVSVPMMKDRVWAKPDGSAKSDQKIGSGVQKIGRVGEG